jgi:hypothetical protein
MYPGKAVLAGPPGIVGLNRNFKNYKSRQVLYTCRKFLTLLVHIQEALEDTLGLAPK